MLRFVQIIVCALYIVPSMLGQSQDYLPLSPRELGAPVPLKSLGQIKETVRLKSGAGPTGASYRVSRDGLIVLDGIDWDGNPWSVDMFTIGCDSPRIYETDLDHNGIVDSVSVRNTCGTGLTPTTHILAVSFDETGRPVPFETEGYFREEAGGIDALVDLNRDTMADLIFMNLDGGYWITNVYTIQSGRWTKVKGPFAGREFPLFTRNTQTSNKVPTKPTSKQPPHAPDLSNNGSFLEGQLVGYSWKDQYSVQLTIKTAVGQQKTCSPNYWYGSAHIVVDLPIGRRVRRLSYQDRRGTDSILEELMKEGYQVKLYGERSPGQCSPELVWAYS